MKQQSKQPAGRAGTYSASEESQLLLRLYMEIGTADFWEGFMKRLAQLADFEGALLATVNVESAEMKAAWSHQVDLEAIRDYVTGGFARDDDLIRFCKSQPAGRFYSSGLNLALTVDYEKDSQVYQKWVAPQGIVDVAMALLEQRGNWATFIAFYRHQPRGFFSDAQLRQLDRVIPHMQRALWLHGDLLRNQRLPEEIESWLSLIKIPALLFDERFDCCEQNRAAREFFTAQQGLRLVDGRLEVDDPAISGQLGYQVIHAVKAATGQAEAEPAVLQFTVGAEPVTCVFIPVKGQADSPLSSAGALVFIYQRDFGQRLNLSALQDVFGLTGAELAVCTQLAQGLSVEEIATAAGKSRETVRSQLKQVYSKTGTSSQPELVLTLLTHPVFLAG